MRQVTETRTILKYSELNEDQKNKVIDKLRDINVNDEDWSEYALEYYTDALKLLGFYDVKFRYSGFWSQGDGASFTGKFKVPKTKKELKERLAACKKEFPTLKLYDFSDIRFDEDEKEGEVLEVYRISHHYSHSNTVSSDNSDLTHFVRDFSNMVYKALESEYDYLTSRECIEETILSNEYEFDNSTLTIE